MMCPRLLLRLHKVSNLIWKMEMLYMYNQDTLGMNVDVCFVCEKEGVQHQINNINYDRIERSVVSSSHVASI